MLLCTAFSAAHIWIHLSFLLFWRFIFLFYMLSSRQFFLGKQVVKCISENRLLSVWLYHFRKKKDKAITNAKMWNAAERNICTSYWNCLLFNPSSIYGKYVFHINKQAFSNKAPYNNNKNKTHTTNFDFFYKSYSALFSKRGGYSLVEHIVYYCFEGAQYLLPWIFQRNFICFKRVVTIILTSNMSHSKTQSIHPSLSYQLTFELSCNF